MAKRPNKHVVAFPLDELADRYNSARYGFVTSSRTETSRVDSGPYNYRLRVPGGNISLCLERNSVGSPDRFAPQPMCRNSRWKGNNFAESLLNG
jgi:hypothetical protein